MTSPSAQVFPSARAFQPAQPGTVYIVGAGPGDVGLFTLKGAHYLGQADVVFHDDLLDRHLLDLCGPTCERVNAGHRGSGDRNRVQEDLNRQLVERARRGQRVVRLKGGDPYIFGRGGEEALALHEAKIPFEVVSGVSAAQGVTACAGIPLTHRNLAAMAVVVTGHEGSNKSHPQVNWGHLAQLPATLVIFMGGRRLPDIAAALLAGGKTADTPAAAIEWGSYPRQRTVSAPLGELCDAVAARELASPTLVVIGGVVGLREELNWFETRPLFGRRILVTRSLDQASSLQLPLESLGAEVSLLPCLEIGPPGDWSPVDAAIDALDRCQWVVFTSTNAVSYFFDRMGELSRDARALGSTRVASVGDATGEALRQRGIEADLIPRDHTQEGLVAAFGDVAVDGALVLIPASNIGRTLLDDALTERGASVSRLIIYENRAPDPAHLQIPARLEDGTLDMLVFASPSAVRHFIELLGRERSMALLSDRDLASIGSTTTRALTDLGLQATVQPAASTVPALVDAICAHYTGAPAASPTP